MLLTSAILEGHDHHKVLLSLGKYLTSDCNTDILGTCLRWWARANYHCLNRWSIILGKKLFELGLGWAQA